MRRPDLAPSCLRTESQACVAPPNRRPPFLPDANGTPRTAYKPLQDWGQMLCKEHLLYRQSQPSSPHSAADTLRMRPPRGASAPSTRYFLPRSTGTPTLPSPPIQPPIGGWMGGEGRVGVPVLVSSKRGISFGPKAMIAEIACSQERA